MFDFLDLFAAGGFWAGFAALYHAGTPAVAAALSDVSFILQVANIWIQRNMARQYRKVVAAVGIEIMIALVITIFFDRALIVPHMTTVLTHAAVSDSTWRSLLLYAMLASVPVLVITTIYLSVKPINLGDILESVVWEANGRVPADKPDGYLDYKARNADVGRLGLVTLLMPAVVPILVIAAGATELIFLGSAYDIGFVPYFIGVILLGILMYVHVVLTRKFLVEIGTKLVAQIAEFGVKLFDELTRTGIAGAVPGLTRAQIDARLQAITVPIVAAIETIKDKWIGIETAVMIFFATSVAFYGHAPFIVSFFFTGVGFIVTAAIDPAYRATNQSYDKARQFGVRFMQVVILAGLVFQLFIELGAGHITPRPTILYYIAAIIGFVDAVISNPFTWVLLMGIAGSACYYKWGSMPRWLQLTAAGVITLLSLVAIGSIIGTDVRVGNIVHVDAGQPMAAPHDAVTPATVIANVRRAVAPPTPAPAPARAPRHARTSHAANTNGVPPCPRIGDPGVDEAFVTMSRNQGDCR